MRQLNIDRDKVNKIIQFLNENIKPNLVYLFGSGANEIFREDSDIDIAFISDINKTDYEIFMLAQKLADMLKRDVDLIDLKKASYMNDVILNKISVIERCIKRINEEYENSPENLKSTVGFRNIAVHDYQL